MAHWEHFHHQADIGVRGIGESLEEAFSQAALALTAVITDLDRVKEEKELTLHCHAPDTEMLLVDWLNALVFEMATRHMLFCRFELQISEQHELSATVWGEAIDPQRHQPAVEVKGATYTALKVRQQEDGNWSAQCVVDV